MKRNKSSSNDSTILLNDIWNWKKKINDPNLTMLEVITEYIEMKNLDPDDVGELLAQNKNFVKILENELINSKVIKSDKEPTTFTEWEN